MKKIITKAILIVLLGVFCLANGCATQPQQKTDTDKVKSHAEDSYKELQHEEHH
ncbi:MAG: hypothetical protein HZA08_11065 [Nitrospirae bacterium]|nr:hypothetical protein [Nitrospirota bacterium]